MILDHHFQPVPPQEIVRRLKQVCPSLGLTFCPGAFWSEQQQRLVDSWAITEEWAPSDKRWDRARRGEIDLAHCFDILTFLPADCSVDEAFGYFERSCQRNQGKAGIQSKLDWIHKYNEQKTIEARREPTELAEELIHSSQHRIISSPVAKHKVETLAKQANKLMEYLDQ